MVDCIFTSQGLQLPTNGPPPQQTQAPAALQVPTTVCKSAAASQDLKHVLPAAPCTPLTSPITVPAQGEAPVLCNASLRELAKAHSSSQVPAQCVVPALCHATPDEGVSPAPARPGVEAVDLLSPILSAMRPLMLVCESSSNLSHCRVTQCREACALCSHDPRCQQP